MWSQSVVRRSLQLRKHLNKVQLVIGLGPYSSFIKGVYYVTLWLTFVERGPSDRSTYTELLGVRLR